MDRSRLAGVAAVLLFAAVAVLVALATGVVGPVLGGYDPAAPGGYTHVDVRAVDDDTGATLGQVRAAVADTWIKRYVGLSGTETLPPDRGMLFVHADEARRTYVMRGMAFGIDIVFADANGTITEIYHAPAPGPGKSGRDQRYPGYGQYVLEVDRGWTTDHDVTVGDRLAFDLED